MKDFIKELIRYLKLPLKFVYWIINLLLFFISLLYVLFKKTKNVKHKSNEQGVLCASYVSISFDGRIKKCANQIAKLGLPVSIIKPYDAQEEVKYELKGLREDVKIIRMGLSGSFSYFPYMFDTLIALYMIFSKNKFIHCHDVNTAFMGILASKLTGKIVVSDLHEWKSETTNVDKTSQGYLQKMAFLIIEKIVVKDSDFVITVNEYIGKAFQDQVKIERDVFIVKNCPESLELEKYNIRSELNISSEFIIGYYVGQINAYRNIVPIIEALKFCPKICLVFQGTISDSYLKVIKDICKKQNISDRVFFLPPVEYHLIPSRCQGADFGVFSCSVDSKSMYYALPNKLFEYIAGGIPILSEDIPFMRKYIERYDIGAMFRSNDSESIIKAFNFLLEEKNLLRIKANSNSAKNDVINKVNKENSLVYKKIYE